MLNDDMRQAVLNLFLSKTASVTEEMQRKFEGLDNSGDVLSERSIRERIGDALRGGDDNYVDYAWVPAASWMAGTPVQMAQKKYISYLPKLVEDKQGFGDTRYKTLADHISKNGVPIVDLPNYPNNAAYNPASKSIMMGKKLQNDAILAHEYGHSRQSNKFLALNMLGKGSIPISAMVAAGAPTEDTSFNAALLGTVASGGMLANEIDASRRGAQVLRQMADAHRQNLKHDKFKLLADKIQQAFSTDSAINKLMKGNINEAGSIANLRGSEMQKAIKEAPALKKMITAVNANINAKRNLTKAYRPLRAYVGLPTYVAASALPMLTHYLKKYLGGFQSEEGRYKELIDKANGAVIKQAAVSNNRVAALARLLEAKRASDAKMYAYKAQLIRELINEDPSAWQVDDPKPYHPGVTHQPTNFRLHVDKQTAGMIPKVANIVRQLQGDMATAIVDAGAGQIAKSQPIKNNRRAFLRTMGALAAVSPVMRADLANTMLGGAEMAEGAAVHPERQIVKNLTRRQVTNAVNDKLQSIWQPVTVVTKKPTNMKRLMRPRVTLPFLIGSMVIPAVGGIGSILYDRIKSTASSAKQ